MNENIKEEQVLKFRNAEDHESPICPFCKKELDELLIKKFDKGLGKISAKAIFCPVCKSVLSINRDTAY